MSDEMQERLERVRDQAQEVYDQLSEMELRTGVVGAARRLVDKIDGTIKYIAKSGAPLDAMEKLAMNAWRMKIAAGSGYLPEQEEWLTKLTEDERVQWRAAAIQFTERQV
jgi:hypothetical protein